MKIGKLTIRAWNKWYWNEMELINPVIIPWRLFWYSIMWLFVVPVYICAYVGFGKYAASNIINAVRYN